MLPTKIRFILLSSFRGEDFLEVYQPETRIAYGVCLLTDWDEMSNLNKEPSIDASYQVSVHLTKWFQKRRIFQESTNEKQDCLWQPCFLMDQDKISKFYRGHSIDASYQVAVHLAQCFHMRRFLEINQPELPMVAMFVKESGRNQQYIQRTFHRCFLPRFGSFC